MVAAAVISVAGPPLHFAVGGWYIVMCFLVLNGIVLIMAEVGGRVLRCMYLVFVVSSGSCTEVAKPSRCGAV